MEFGICAIFIMKKKKKKKEEKQRKASEHLDKRKTTNT